MKKNIKLLLVALCLQIGLVHAMQEQTKPTQDQLHERLLLAIIGERKIDEIKKVIREGADIKRTYAGFAVLHQPKVLKNSDILTILIEAGAGVNAIRHTFGWTPLHSAAKLGRAHAVQILIEAGADTNAIDNEGNIPIQLAKPKDRADVIRAFVTSVSSKEIQHVIPAIIALTKHSSNIGKDVGSLIAAQLIPEIVREKLALAKQSLLMLREKWVLAKQCLPDVPEDQFRQETIASINRVITKSPRIQAAVQQPAV